MFTNPIYYSMPFFIGSFIFMYILIRNSTKVNNYVLGFSKFIQKNSFPSYSQNEYLKFSLIRIIFGLVLFYRCVNIQIYLADDELFNVVGILSISYIIATVLLTVGFLTQYALIYLVFGVWQLGDMILTTSTLGNDIGAMLAILLLLTGSGKYLSIDGEIIKKFTNMSFFFLYPTGNVPSNVIALIKFSAITSYWAVCVYSLSMHLNESAWMNGTAASLLLTNNFAGPFHVFFISLFSSSELAVQMSKYSMWLMMIWYSAILPFILLGGLWKTYIVTWGLLFFTFSFSLLTLGVLPEIEFLLWAALFWSKVGIFNGEKVKVFYDDKCNLCDKTIRFICFVDVFDIVKLKPISKNNDALKALNITLDDAINDLYGVVSKNNNVKFGYDFYLLIARKVVLLWPLYPIIYLGKLFTVGPFIYNEIAKRRIILFGLCKIPSKKSSYTKRNSVEDNCFFQKATSIHIIFLTICYLLYIPAPPLPPVSG